MPLTRNLIIPSIASDFELAVGWGLIRGYTRVAAFGFNPDADTASPEDVWTGGGIYPWLTAATSLELVSSSTNDSAAGTGTRTVMVSGLDINYVAVTQIVTMNGTTPVALATPLFRVNGLLSITAGSNSVNVGTITLRDAGAGTTRALMTIGIGITQQAQYTVPASQTLQIVSIYNSIIGTGSSRTVDISPWFRNSAGAARSPITLTAADGRPYRHDGKPGIMVAEKTDVSMRCLPSNDNCVIQCAWLAILRVNQ